MATTTTPTQAVLGTAERIERGQRGDQAILDAAQFEDPSYFRRWLEGGGDPNVAYSGTLSTTYYEGETPLMVAAMSGRVEVMRVLIQAGADFTITRAAYDGLGEEEGEIQTALSLAFEYCEPEAAQLLLDHGADKSTFQLMSQSQSIRTLDDHRILRMFYIAGVDFSAREVDGHTFEAKARSDLAKCQGLGSAYAHLVKRYANIVSVIDGVRLAGSYREYVLHEYKQLLRIRSLLSRGRATMAPQTPEVVARLFGETASASRCPPTRRSRPPPQRSAGVPDAIFLKVLEYYRLGDWRRPYTLPGPYE